MATTRERLAEQAEREYMRSFDREDIKPKLERRATMLLVDQVANALLGLRLQEETRIGVVDVPTCMIATYYDIPTTNGKADLPVIPIRLPMDLGVWSIKSSDGEAYIPVKTEWWDLMGGLDEGQLEGYVGYYVRGRKVHFTGEPTETVDMELLIVDPSLLGPHDPYPIPADLEEQVVERVVALLRQGPLAPEKPKN